MTGRPLLWGSVVVAAAVLTVAARPLEETEILPAEKAYSGTVVKIAERQCEVCKQVEVTVVLKTSKGKVDIRLGPKPFLQEHSFLPEMGDTLSVVGVHLHDNGKQAIFANEIGKGGEHLILRGKFGRPEWLGPHGETCAKCGI